MKATSYQSGRTDPAARRVALAAVLVLAAAGVLAGTGASYDFSGGPVEIAPHPSYGEWPLTVECRVRLDRRDRYNIIVAHESKASPRHWELFTMPKTGHLTAFLPGFKPNHFHTGVNIADGKWHDLSMVVENDRMRLFVDGELRLDQAAKPPKEPGRGEAMKLGGLVDGALDCAGRVAWLRISRGALDGAGDPGKPLEAGADTLGLWLFDPSRAVPGTDLSALANHAVIPVDLGDLIGSGLDLSKGMIRIPFADLPGKRPLTIEAFVKIPPEIVYARFNRRQTLMAFGQAHDIPSIGHWRLEIDPAGRLEFMVDGDRRVATPVINDGKWHHLAIVLEPDRTSIVLDGQLQQLDFSPVVAPDACPARPRAEALVIGGLEEGALVEANAEIGELRIRAGVAGSGDRIPLPPLGPDEQTLGLWRFDRLGHEEYADLSGNGRKADFVKTDPAALYSLPKAVNVEPLRKAATAFAKELGLRHVDFANIRNAVFEQWYKDYHCHGKTYDHYGDPRWNEQAVEEQAFDRHALILPEDGGPAGTVLRRTAALISHLQVSHPSNADLLRFLSQLEADRRKLGQAWQTMTNLPESSDTSRAACYVAACAIRRKAMFANPLLDFDQILFVARGTYQGSKRSIPQTTDGHGGHFSTQYFGFNALPGGGLYRVKNWKTNPEVVNILENSQVENGRLKGGRLDHGAFATPDLSFDGRTIAFAWTANPDHEWEHYSRGRAFHLFKVNTDGSGLTQLTDGIYNDFDPCWLPGGRMAFVSERRGGYIRCFGFTKVPQYSLFSMRGDGSDIVPLSYYETSEWNPSVDNDGMLVYTRWDYTDRENCLGSRIWISRPDGTDPRAPHGNYPHPWHTFPDRKLWSETAPGRIGRDSRTGTPFVQMGIRSIPGSHRYVFAGAAHHGQIDGSLGILDLRIQDDGHMSQVRRLTPDEPFPETEIRARSHYKYATPWALSEDLFLANVWEDLALLDRFGNRESICELSRIPARPDERLRLIDPIPLRPRPVPPEIPARTFQGANATPDAPKATISIMNVYDSHLPFPPDRKVKWLRVVQNILKTNPYMGKPMIGYERENTPRIPLGIVPVEEDGSAYFEAPVAKELIFQPLDGNFMAVQSMRSVAFVHPGEQLSCLGCHEPRNKAPSVGAMPMALKRPPSKIEPEIGPVEPISYYRQIKPVFDKTCVTCHREQGKGPVDMSYEALRDDTFWFSGGMAFHMASDYSGIRGGSRSIPGRFGAAYSNIGRALFNETHRKAVSAEDRHKVIVWLDNQSLRLGAYIREQEQLDGKLVWPSLDVDPANPQGVEGVEPGLKRNFWHENLYGPHAFLGTSHQLKKIYLMDNQGEIVWDYPVPNPQDAWMLPNGNILATWLHGVKEITRAKETVWEFTVEAPNEVPTCQPLPNGNVLVGIVGQCRLIELDRGGAIVHEIKLQTTVERPHAQFRMCRQTPEGTYLVPFTAEGAVREYDRTGRVIREFPSMSRPVCAVRLPDGNTLITADKKVTEFDPNNNVVWQMTEDDVPGIAIAILAGVQRKANGNTVVCNWNAVPCGDRAAAHVFEVTPSMRVVWQVDADSIGQVAQCQLLTDALMPRDEEIWR